MTTNNPQTLAKAWHAFAQALEADDTLTQTEWQQLNEALKSFFEPVQNQETIDWDGLMAHPQTRSIVFNYFPHNSSVGQAYSRVLDILTQRREVAYDAKRGLHKPINKPNHPIGSLEMIGQQATGDRNNGDTFWKKLSNKLTRSNDDSQKPTP